MTEKELKRLEQKVYEYETKVNGALEDLSNAATQILGYKIVADLCSGGSEIEFRVIGDDGWPDPESCIRIEEILGKI